MNNTTDFIADIPTKQDNGILPDIDMYGTLVWVPLGIILNLFSLITFIKCENFSTSIGTFLKSLSVADNILVIGLFCMSIDDYWKAKLNIPVIGHLNNPTCKFSVYIVHIGFLTSGLILASATIE